MRTCVFAPFLFGDELKYFLAGPCVFVYSFFGTFFLTSKFFASPAVYFFKGPQPP